MSVVVKNLSDKVFNEPLSQDTFSIRKNLLLVSCITVLLTVYNVQIHELPWVKLRLENNADSSSLLLGALSVAIAYFLLRFFISALSDLIRWKNAGNIIKFNDFIEMSKQAMEYHWTIEAYTSGLRRGRPLNNPEQLKAASEKAIEWFNDAKNEARNVKVSYITLSFLQWIKLIVVDLGIPFVMGVLSLSLSKDALLPFILVLFKS